MSAELAQFLGAVAAILIAVVGSYAGIRSALARQDVQRTALAESMIDLKKTVEDLKVSVKSDIRRIEDEMLRMRDKQNEHTYRIEALNERYRFRGDDTTPTQRG